MKSEQKAEKGDALISLAVYGIIYAPIVTLAVLTGWLAVVTVGL